MALLISTNHVGWGAADSTAEILRGVAASAADARCAEPEPSELRVDCDQGLDQRLGGSPGLLRGHALAAEFFATNVEAITWGEFPEFDGFAIGPWEHVVGQARSPSSRAQFD
jgi:hypothetical protein